MSKEGRCLGLIGGLEPNATVYYYRGLLAAHETAGRTARMLIAHADVNRSRAVVEANDLDGLARYLAGFASELKAGGAELTAIVAVTPHICADKFNALSPLPLIDMVRAVADAIRARGLKRVALLGTHSTVETRMFGGLPADVVMPKPAEIEQIHNTYIDVVYDRSTPHQIDRLRELARTLIKRDGAEAVLIAGTDFSTILNEENAGFPALDCASVHVKAIVHRLLQ